MIYRPATRTPIVGVYGFKESSMLVITAVYKGADLVWTLVRSCYGRGVWFEEKPWLDNDTWKDNK